MNNGNHNINVFKHSIISNQVEQGDISDRTWRILNRIADEPSLNPEKPRKSRNERLHDLVAWLRKYRYINSDYNECGMDILGFDRWEEYVDHYSGHLEAFKKFQYYRGSDGIIPRPINAVLSDDKFAFFAYLESICPGCTPNIPVYILRGGKVSVSPGIFEDADIAIKKLPDGKYVCKPSLGQCGRNVIVITVKDGDYTLNDGMTKDDLMKCFRHEPYIVQDFIVQHAGMNRLNESSVNTVRITTTRFNQNAHLFTAIVRVGIGNALVDNAAAGGTCIGVDCKTGKLLKYGHYHTKPKETKHPTTGLVYEGYQIPYWKESVALAKHLHEYFRGFPSIGWDIAITENGPVVIENNYDWAFGIQQQIYGGLRRRWEEAKKLP